MRGIGETRAALIEDDAILEARIEPEGMLTAGTVVEARLARRIPARNQGIAVWDSGEALLAPLPPGVTQGALCRIEITRPPTPEPGKPKRARARPAAPDARPGPGPDLTERLPGARIAGPLDGDPLLRAGWSELTEQAETGRADFPGGALSLHLTPAMALIDIDGELAADALALAGARAAAQMIRRLDITGSVGIDLPTLPDRAARQAAAEAVDAVLPQPFERTAVNGFGFLQIVRRRERLSLPELYALDPAAWHARALLATAERTPGMGERLLTAHPTVITAIEARPDWTERLARALGAPLALRSDAMLAISAGHVQARHP